MRLIFLLLAAVQLVAADKLTKRGFYTGGAAPVSRPLNLSGSPGDDFDYMPSNLYRSNSVVVTNLTKLTPGQQQWINAKATARIWEAQYADCKADVEDAYRSLISTATASGNKAGLRAVYQRKQDQLRSIRAQIDAWAGVVERLEQTDRSVQNYCLWLADRRLHVLKHGNLDGFPEFSNPPAATNAAPDQAIEDRRRMWLAEREARRSTNAPPAK